MPTEAVLEVDLEAWTASRVHDGLYEHFTRSGWSLLEEVTCEDPAAIGPNGYYLPGMPATRRIDVLAVRTPKRPTAGGVDLGSLQTLAIEVKVSRADFAHDVAHPEKQAPWRALTHQHAYAVPEGLVAPHEVPDGSGLLYLAPHARRAGTVTWARRAPYSPGELPATFLRYFAARAATAESRIKGRARRAASDDPAELRLQMDRVEAQLALAAGKLEREKQAAARWRAIAVSGGYPMPCATCGHPVKPTSVRSDYAPWRHVYPEHEVACEPMRPMRGRWRDPVEPAEPQ